MHERRPTERKTGRIKKSVNPEREEQILAQTLNLQKWFPSLRDAKSVAEKLQIVQENIHLPELEKIRAEIKILEEEVEANIESEEEKKQIRWYLSDLYIEAQQLEKSGESARRNNP